MMIRTRVSCLALSLMVLQAPMIGAQEETSDTTLRYVSTGLRHCLL